jgi:hypothetical protein
MRQSSYVRFFRLFTYHEKWIKTEMCHAHRIGAFAGSPLQDSRTLHSVSLRLCGENVLMAVRLKKPFTPAEAQGAQRRIECQRAQRSNGEQPGIVSRMLKHTRY